MDGIHLDDYFYPYPDSKGTPFPDDVTYQRYVDDNGTLSRDDWRRNNVNRMVGHGVLATSGDKYCDDYVRLSVCPLA